MGRSMLERVPETRREAAEAAVATAFGASPVASLEPMPGGASGALTYRIGVDGRDYVLRLEAGLDSPLRNPHQYDCMRAAADAGIAPPLRFADADSGVVVMDLLAQRPLQEYPGGPPALARDLGRLIAHLQAVPAFPRLHDFGEVVQGLFGFLRSGGVIAAGLLDEHADGFDRINAAYRWSPDSWVSSHNDPNPGNILFDGERLWLVDWESAFRNDPLTDVAILTQFLAPTPDLERAVVEAWLGRPPEPATLARLALMRQFTRLYYAGLVFMVTARTSPAEPETDLRAPTGPEFGAALASGELEAGSPDMLRTLGKMSLAAFLAGIRAPEFESLVATVAASGPDLMSRK